ncbi:hypothetical protein GGD67_002876 [Bradyrhizobium sp. IAR9]|nr:hypothetical protein [Bradyrhizobium sp. IAR9]NYG45418.1 hypothetical protein [Bradyrhizobium sp. IAR9]
MSLIVASLSPGDPPRNNSATSKRAATSQERSDQDIEENRDETYR